MNEEKFSLRKIKDIYKEYPEILEKEERLNRILTEEEKKNKEKSGKVSQITNKRESGSKKKILVDNSEEVKRTINHLFEILKRDGIETAIRAAKKMNNPFILDGFHDKLIEQGFFSNDEMR